jgi:regulator of protease activity HflC (stomatin/prohibitin superfamily)
VLVIVPAIIVGAILYAIYGTTNPTLAIVIEAVFVIILYIIVSGVRVAAQWERGVVLRLGRFEAVRGPGVIYIIPFLDTVRFVDNRVLALNVPGQHVITKDNVPAQIDGVIFFYVADAELAITKVQDFTFAIGQYAQAALRDVVGALSLDDLLTEREQIQERIGMIVEKHIKEWGIHIDSIRLLDIDMPEELKRMMSRQASAEREKRATITKAQGDKEAAVNLAAAAATMAQSPGAMQLRTLQTIDGLGSGSSNTVVLFPTEFSDMADKVSQIFRKSEK